MNDSEQELCVWSIRIEVYGVSVILFSRIPRLKALIFLNTGWPDSLNRSTIRVAVESHFPLGVKGRVPFHFFSSPGRKNVQCPCENLCPIDVVEHWHEDDSVCEFSDSMFHFRKSFRDLLKNLQWRKLWENTPLEFCCFSIDSQQLFVRRRHIEFFHLTFPSYNCIFPIIHFHQALYVIKADKHFCFCPLDHVIMRQHWSRPGWRGAVNRMYIENLFRMLQYQFLCDIE